MSSSIVSSLSARRRPTIADVFSIVEIRTKIVSLSSFSIGTLYAVYTGHPFQPLLFTLMLAAVLCVDLGTAGFNSYYDYLSGVDRPEYDVVHAKALVHKPLDPRLALWISLACFVAAVALGLAIGALAGWGIVVVGAACMAVSYFYSGGPYPLSRTPFGEVFAGGAMGLVLLVLSVYVQAGSVDVGAWLLGLPSTALIAGLMTVNNTCDAVGDAAAGRRTLSIVLGARVLAVIDGLGIAGFGVAAVLAAAGVVPRLTLLPLAIAAGLALRLYRLMRRRGYGHASKSSAMGDAAAAFLLYTLALSIGLGIGIAVR